MNLTGRVHDDLKSFSKKPAPRPFRIPRTWVMVVDQHIVRLFERNEGELEPIGTAHPEPEEDIALNNKSVGRVLSSSSRSIHHKYEPHMNESRQRRLSFAHQISDWLDEAVRENAFDRLILAAAPKTLGDLRKAVTQPVRERIFAEINKDLTKLDVRTLQEELERILSY